MSHLWPPNLYLWLAGTLLPTYPQVPLCRPKEAIMLPPPSNLIPFPEERLEELRVPHRGLGPAPVERSPTPGPLLAGTAAPAPSGGSDAQLQRTPAGSRVLGCVSTGRGLPRNDLREHQAPNGKGTLLLPSV